MKREGGGYWMCQRNEVRLIAVFVPKEARMVSHSQNNNTSLYSIPVSKIFNEMQKAHLWFVIYGE